MLSLPPSVRVYLAAQPADMRKSFDGLACMIREFLGQEPLSGHLFVFRSRRGDRIKIFYWDRSGYCLFYKRLEKSVFHFPKGDGYAVEIEAAELTLILEGIDLAGAKRRPRFVLEPCAGGAEKKV